MPHQIYLILGLFLALALSFLWLSIRAWAAKRLLPAGVNTLMTALMLSLFALGLLLLANLYSYQQFTYEKTIATLRLEKIAINAYRVHLHDVASNLGRRFPVYGDEWQLDARILIWENAGILLGLKPLYRLERLSGRYRNSDAAMIKPANEHQLNRQTSIELWELAQQLKPWLPLVDVVHGSASYMPMADGAAYQVSINHKGLVARPANETAKQALQRWH